MTDQYYAIAYSPVDIGGDGAVVATVRLSGEFDLGACEDLHAAVRRVVAGARARSIVVDLTEVTFIDAATVGVLFSGYVTAQQQRKNFWVAGARGPVQRVLAVLDATRLLQRCRLYS